MAAAGIEGSSLTVTATATVTVTAADPGGLTTVEAANQAPEAVGDDSGAGDDGRRRSGDVDVSPFFSDPDGDELTYTAESSDAEVAAAVALRAAA